MNDAHSTRPAKLAAKFAAKMTNCHAEADGSQERSRGCRRCRRKRRARTFVSVLSSISAMLCASATRAQNSAPPAIQLWSIESLQNALERYHGRPDQPDPDIAHLLADARAAMQRPIGSVMEKKTFPPSGDKHDYMSVAIYFWPDPTKRDGLPYINRDGVRNESLKTEFPDADNLEKMMRGVATLAPAAFISGDSNFADKAVQALRIWFVDPATRINPNLQFAQARPGRDAGTPQGTIEIHWLPDFLDSIKLLESMGALNDGEKDAMHSWMREFLAWLRTSKQGVAAAHLPNNIGTYYDADVVGLALFCGDVALAKSALDKTKTTRIAAQISSDGQQPLETERTKGLGYSIFNLEALMTLARYGESAGVDLWNYRGPRGGSIKAAIDFIAPFAVREKQWPLKQIEDYNPQNFVSLLYRARKVYGEAPYAKYWNELPAQPRTADRCHIVY